MNIKKIKEIFRERFQIFGPRFKKHKVLFTTIFLLFIGFIYNEKTYKRKLLMAKISNENERIFIDMRLANKSLKEKTEILLKPLEDDIVIGVKQNPKVSIVDYSSYTCRHCRAMRSEIAKLLDEYKDKEDFQYIIRPVSNRQTIAFNVFLNCLNDDQQRLQIMDEFFAIDWSKPKDVRKIIFDTAEKYNIDKDFTRNCIDNEENYRKAIYYQREGSVAFYFEQVPTLVINGKKYMGFKDYDKLSKIIKAQYDSKN